MFSTFNLLSPALQPGKKTIHEDSPSSAFPSHLAALCLIAFRVGVRVGVSQACGPSQPIRYSGAAGQRLHVESEVKMLDQSNIFLQLQVFLHDDATGRLKNSECC